MCVPWKPCPFDNEHHFIADGDNDKPIMWHVKLVERKDLLKKADGSWAFPSEFEGYSKMMMILEITKPLHVTGKVVVGGNGFCVQDGGIALHQRECTSRCTSTSMATGKGGAGGSH